MAQDMTQNTQVNAYGSDISFLDLIYPVVASWRLLLMGPLMIGLIVLGATFLIRPTYTATTEFLPPQQQQSAAAVMLQSLGSFSGLAGAAAGLKNPADQYISFLTSKTIEGELIKRFQLKSRYKAELNEEAASMLAANTRISAGKDGLIKIEVDDIDPIFAARLANGYVEELEKLVGRLAVTEAQQRRQFFDKQLQQTKKNLTRAEIALKETGINSADLKMNPGSAVAAIAFLQAQVAAQEIKLGSMRGYLTESAPQFKKAQSELAALREQSRKAANTTQLNDVGNSDYISKYREMKYHETLFELFAKQFELAKIDESREGAMIQVIDVAYPPERKSKPKKAMLSILATISTGFALLLFVFARQAVQNMQRDSESSVKLARLRNAWRKQ